jgi:hypothetical protein
MPLPALNEMRASEARLIWFLQRRTGRALFGARLRCTAEEGVWRATFETREQVWNAEASERCLALRLLEDAVRGAFSRSA